MEKNTPAALGYYMPAEWSRHESTWLAWPLNETTFPKPMMSAVENAYCLIISVLSEGEKVNVLVNDEALEESARRRLSSFSHNEKNVIFQRIKNSDVWIRDYGPLFLLNRREDGKAAVKWKYNAYGNKYDDLLYDDITGMDVAKAAHAKIFEPGMVLEGGSIEVDGQGTLLTTEQCLLNKNRNPSLSRAQIEDYLKNYSGVSKIIWLKSGIEGDDTDGHVDDFARFTSPGQVLCSYTGEAGNPDSAALRANLDILRSSTDADGNKLEIAKFPMPRPIIDDAEKRRLPASYANFYIANKAVLLPVFQDPRDSEAAEILEGCFPGREIVQIPSRELAFGYGGVHCITQQEPFAKGKSAQ